MEGFNSTPQKSRIEFYYSPNKRSFLEGPTSHFFWLLMTSSTCYWSQEIGLEMTHHLAQKIGISRIVFYSFGVFLTICFDRLWRNPKAVNPGSKIKFEDLSNAPRFPWDQVHSLFRRCKEAESDPSFEYLKNSMAANGLNWDFVFNTFL
ncbi:Uncharacterized protein Fot_38504 [Forsythia ovata]|uniref:Uncharacterized protein n=1 Tax=Forsythia ovata TaxID=205694 RepID=A0ABD1S234_9LAMI